MSVAVSDLVLVRCMARKQTTGQCDKCSQPFGYYLIHNGFNVSSYAYCDSCCYLALLDLYGVPQHIPKLDFGAITPDVEPYLLPCPSRGYFKAGASARCPHCDQPLGAVRAADYIEANARGTASGWRWQRSWTGLYCLIIEERVAHNPWKSPHCT